MHADSDRITKETRDKLCRTLYYNLPSLYYTPIDDFSTLLRCLLFFRIVRGEKKLRKSNIIYRICLWHVNDSTHGWHAHCTSYVSQVFEKALGHGVEKRKQNIRRELCSSLFKKLNCAERRKHNAPRTSDTKITYADSFVNSMNWSSKRFLKSWIPFNYLEPLYHSTIFNQVPESCTVSVSIIWLY